MFQTASLFMLGMLAGRKSLFAYGPETKKFWIRTLIVASAAFIPLFIVKTGIPAWISSVAINRPLSTIVSSWSNLAFMLVLVSGFFLLFNSEKLHRALNIFSSFGRMSMSNYIIQSMLGSCIYYGFGLGLYKYTGATYSLLIGIVLATLQGLFSSWWFCHFSKGPLETIWHKATWIGSR